MAKQPWLAVAVLDVPMPAACSPSASQASGVISAGCSPGIHRPLSWLCALAEKLLAQAAEDEAKEPIAR